MKTSKFAIVGVGGWGRQHVATYLDHPLVELVAICDQNPETLEKVGQQTGVERRFTDYCEMLSANDLEIDAVSVATPDFAHADAALAAVESGRHVLLEKPLATTLEDCDRLGAALAGSSVKFMVDFHNRWNPAMVSFKKSIDKGEIGAVQMGSYRLNDNISVPTDMLSWAGRSSVNWFLASHCLDTLMWLLDDRIREVYTVQRSRVLAGMGIDTPDFYQSILQFEKGAAVMLENCWILAGAHALIDMKVEIVGDQGALFFDGRPHLVESYSHDAVDWPDVYVCPEIHGKPRGLAIDSIRHFADCVCFDREPLVGFDAGREVTRVILAMERSAREGQPVTL